MADTSPTTRVGFSADATPAAPAPQPTPPVMTAETSRDTAPAAPAAEASAPQASEGAPAAPAMPAPPSTGGSDPLIAQLSAGATQPLVVPGSVRLAFDVTGQRGPQPMSGVFGELVWLQNGAEYNARLSLKMLFRTFLSQTSTGRVDGGGIAPIRYSEKRKTEVASHLEPEPSQVPRDRQPGLARADHEDPRPLAFAPRSHPDHHARPGRQPGLGVHDKIGRVFHQHPVGSSRVVRHRFRAEFRGGHAWGAAVKKPSTRRSPES